jgi:hypothetical protein
MIDSYKLFESIDEEDFFDIAKKAEGKVFRGYGHLNEEDRKDTFINYLIDELRIYFMSHVEFEPVALHYVDKHWADNHSDRAAELEEADRRSVI